jgi:SulP family sulfate permease
MTSTEQRARTGALARYLPVLQWGRDYDRDTLTSDLVAAVIVTIMLIPQSLAYALLAGLPPEMGIYASIAPIILYAIFGTSRALAVGPVAVVSLMTAAAVGRIAEVGSTDYITAAITLAFLSGVFLLAMGVLRLGFLANFLSHPVIAGFITASGIIIAASQLKHVLGISASGHNLYELLVSLVEHLGGTNLITLAIGAGSAAFLFWVRKGLKPLLIGTGMNARLADIIAKAGPVLAVAVTTLLAWGLDLGAQGVKLVGDVPQGLPPLTLPSFSMDLWTSLIGSAVLISIIGFVESVSVAQTLAAKKRQRIKPDQELIGLGAANVGAAFTGGFPVTGGFSRSVVNFDAGAETPAAGAFTAVGLAIASLALTPLIAYLPIATLAATIIVAVLSLVDFSILKKTWAYSRADFAAVAITILATLLLGVEIGVSCRCCAVGADPPVQELAPTRGRGWPGAWHRAFPQCAAAQGDYRRPHPDLAGGREPLLRQCAFSGRLCLRCDCQAPAAQTRHPDVPCHQCHRHERAGVAGVDQRTAEIVRRDLPFERGQRPGHGPPATLAFS